jgi:undecaprenyl-diphosphatase
MENRVLALVAAAALAVYGSGLIHPPDLETVIRDVGEALGPYTYVLVGLMSFLEVGAFVGLVAPGEFTVIFGGVVAGQGEIDVVILIGIVWACAVAGDCTGFALGRRLGREFLLRHGPKFKMTKDRLEQVERFFARHGGKTILIGRFVGLVRAMAPFVAGASRMSFRRFFPFDVVAAGAWSTFFCLLGYIFWQSFDQVVDYARRGAFGLGVAIVVVVGGVAAYRYLRVPDNRARAAAWLDEQAQRPAVRPLIKVLRPVWRRAIAPVWRRVAPVLKFTWDRVTPGQLGLELTTLLAVASVGSFLFFGLASIVERDERLSTDASAFDVADDVRSDLLTDVAQLVTDVGTTSLVGGFTLGVVLYLVARRRLIEGVTLAAGSALMYVALHVAKDAVDRPRPSGAIVETEGSSFPSGHAAYAIAYVAAVVALGHAFPRFVYRATFVVGVIVVAAAVGLSRVYLRAHYLSDALAGWGLAAAVFAICGIAGLIVAFVRQNGRQRS